VSDDAGIPRSGARADVDETSRQAADAVNLLIRTIDGFRHRIAQDAGVGITELRALNRVAISGTMSPKQLADSLDLTTGTVTALLDRLERAELVTRTAHPTDRRMLRIQLTPLGHERLQVVLSSFDSRIFAAAENFPPDTVAGATAFLRNVSDELARYSTEWRRAAESSAR
jgi:DNA-binding MarR family transcriptional regulator